jgi:ABC-type multidrug transport system ATPase subunit
VKEFELRLPVTVAACYLLAFSFFPVLNILIGMDPVNRRFVWKHIDEVKKDRVVLLTTHAMEEADLLADMVAIMRKGELAAWGSPLDLKAQHGSALQFSIMVDRAQVARTDQRIRAHFANSIQWVKIDAGEAGNITVNIQKIQQSPREQGVDVPILTSFVAWLEDSEQSGVTEYGFSNSSLEEVFLKVTEGDVDETQTNGNVEHGTVSSEIDEDVGQITPETGRNLAAFKPNLTVRGQVRALVWQNFIRTWTGSRSLGSWLLYGIFLSASTMVSIWLGGSSGKTPYLTISVVFASFILLSICGGIYGDRVEGLFYLMRTQGLLKNSYLLGIMVYGFLVAFVYVTILLGALYATPFFRVPSVCTPDFSNNFFCDSKFGQLPVISTYEVQDVTFLWKGDEAEEANGEVVQLFAYPVPGGYSYVFGASVVFALTIPGAALASAYLPGNKFALIAIAMLTLISSITPLITFFLSTFISTDEEITDCINRIVPISLCEGSFYNKTLDSDFLNCVGTIINQRQSFCTPSYTALLPQYGLFQMLSMALNSDIKFFTEPASYNEEVFIPSITGGFCSGDTCSFPYANSLYLENMGWTVLGGLILIIIGIVIAHIFAFPTASVLYVKDMLTHGIESMKCRKERHGNLQTSEVDKEELEEVMLEREAVEAIIQPLLVPGPDGDGETDIPVIADHSNIARDDLPPILMHKLRKVYPSFGRLPPKVALNSLDLHVPRGQVLGFLGKNGAGKFSIVEFLLKYADKPKT